MRVLPYSRTSVRDVDRRAERQQAREASHHRVAHADAAVADARPDRGRLVRAVDPDSTVAARELVEHVRMAGEGEGERAVRAARIRLLEQRGDEVGPGRRR